MTDNAIVSFPKSGRTWTKSFLSNYFSLYYNVDEVSNFSKIIRFGNERKMPRILFMHGNHRDESSSEEERFISRIRDKNIILLVRNPAEIVYTYYHRLVKRMNDAEVKGMDFSEFIRDENVGIVRIIRFLNKWHASSGRFNSFSLVRYEDCVSDPVVQFGNLLNYIGADADEETIKEALKRSVDTTRKIEEGGLSRDDIVLSDISKGSGYFEKSDGMSGLFSYAGNKDGYDMAFSSKDKQFVNERLKELHADFGYSGFQ